MTSSAKLFHPLIQSWFSDKFENPTEIQEKAWPKIAAGENLLITAPTGSGKTLTAFLWAINQFLLGRYETGTSRVLYISPLKALNNDIQRNLVTPLTELRILADLKGIEFPDIRVQTRSGDTDTSERRRMLRQPPEILITTPESLNLLLSSKGGQGMLGGFKTVILDEIHGVIADKRGVYLMSAIERLVPFCGEFQRIALSATVNPLDKIAQFVGGYRRLDNNQFEPRLVETLTSHEAKRYQVTVRYPQETANRPADEKVWDSLAEDFVEKIRKNTSTLLFVNSRAMCEKITFKINNAANETLAYAHHGSLSREIRTEVEQKLKQGQLSAIVATSTLEMGIDIGHLDEVILIQSPDGISSAIQRIGRAGHGVGEVSRCTIYPTHPTDFIEAAVLAKAVIEKDIEPIKTIECPLDVLSQIIISMSGTMNWDIDELFIELRRSTAFHKLDKLKFDLVINMLSGRYAENHIRELRPKVIIDRDTNTISARPGALMSLYLSGGVIPDRGYFQLRHEQGNARIGELDEEFVWEANVGKVFSLGTQHWQVKKITHNDVIVGPAKPTSLAPPFWKSEGLNRNFHYAERVAEFLEFAEQEIDKPVFHNILINDHNLEPLVATELVTLLKGQRSHCQTQLPHRHHLLIEKTQSSPGRARGHQVILHTGWGAEVNRPLAMAMEAGWQRKYNAQPEIWVSNESLVVQLTENDDARDLFSLVPVNDIEELLRDRLEGSGFFGARFRENAGRALLLSKGKFNERKPLWMSRLQSQKLMAAVLKFEDFPILLETWRTCLQDEFDLENLKLVLDELDSGQIEITEVTTATPSPFARTVAWGQINTYMYMDDQPKASKTSNLRTTLLEEIVFQPGIRPPIPIDIIQLFIEKRQRTLEGYEPDNSSDLIEWVKERTAIPSAEWQLLLEQSGIDWMEVKHKLVKMNINQRELTVAREDEQILVSYFADPDKPYLANWLQYYGPISSHQISEETGLEKMALEPLLSGLVEDRILIHGQLILEDDRQYWCDADNYEILLRFVRQQARVSFEPLPITQLTPFLYNWQTRLKKSSETERLFDTIEMLRCYPSNPKLWESEILPSRVDDYQTDQLDTLFQESNLFWLGDVDKRINFTFREDLDLLANSADKGSQPSPQTSEPSADTAPLFDNEGGRYDFATLLDKTGLTSSLLAEQLWQSVWRGEVSNDSVMALRKGIETRYQVPVISGHQQHRNSRRIRRGGFQQWRSSIPFSGNWFRLEQPDEPGDLIESEEINKDRVRVLLDRYGVLFRELLQHELFALQWRQLFRSLRLMELAGEVYSGYFFADIPGPQFISPAALRFIQGHKNDAVFWINAADPVSSCGLPFDKIRAVLPRRVMSSHLTYHGKDLVMVSTRNGKSLDIRVKPDHPLLDQYLGSFRHLLYRAFQPLNKITIESINEEAARQSPYFGVFEQNFDVVSDYKAIYLQRRI